MNNNWIETILSGKMDFLIHDTNKIAKYKFIAGNIGNEIVLTPKGIFGKAESIKAKVLGIEYRNADLKVTVMLPRKKLARIVSANDNDWSSL